jgi:hypothetical protein
MVVEISLLRSKPHSRVNERYRLFATGKDECDVVRKYAPMTNRRYGVDWWAKFVLHGIDDIDSLLG